MNEENAAAVVYQKITEPGPIAQRDPDLMQQYKTALRLEYMDFMAEKTMSLAKKQFGRVAMPSHIKTPEQLAAIYLAACELGVNLSSAVGHIYVVNGVQAVDTRMMAVLVSKYIDGAYFQVESETKTSCTILFHRPGRKDLTVTRTIDDVKKAKALSAFSDDQPQLAAFIYTLREGMKRHFPEVVAMMPNIYPDGNPQVIDREVEDIQAKQQDAEIPNDIPDPNEFEGEVVEETSEDPAPDSEPESEPEPKEPVKKKMCEPARKLFGLINGYFKAIGLEGNELVSAVKSKLRDLTMGDFDTFMETGSDAEGIYSTALSMFQKEIKVS